MHKLNLRGSLAHQRRADVALLLVAAIWGGTFVMVQDAVAAFPVFGFLALRFAVATFAFTPLLASRRRQPSSRLTSPTRGLNRGAAAFIGLLLFTGYAFQTYGLRLTTPAKAGFITGLSVVLVPLGSALFLRRSPTRNAVAGVALATLGLALLTLDTNWQVAAGDLLVLGCAIAFAGHILLVGYYAPQLGSLALAVGQVATVAVLSGAMSMLVDGPPRWPPGTVWFAVVFTGVLATTFAFGAQTYAQRFTSPTHTALIFATEPVFAAIFSFLLIGEQFTMRGLIGCALILAGMLASEIGPRTQDDDRILEPERTQGKKGTSQRS